MGILYFGVVTREETDVKGGFGLHRARIGSLFDRSAITVAQQLVMQQKFLCNK
uniref:Uncharacterized protein n=1 Tax=Meloidogyne incognita TaxID=6306 RepID=A0A914MPX9_MELIC